MGMWGSGRSERDKERRVQKRFMKNIICWPVSWG